MNEKMTSFFRYLAYAMEIVLLYVLGTTPDLLPQLFGAKPTPLLCVALTAAHSRSARRAIPWAKSSMR